MQRRIQDFSKGRWGGARCAPLDPPLRMDEKTGDYTHDAREHVMTYFIPYRQIKQKKKNKENKNYPGET